MTKRFIALAILLANYLLCLQCFCATAFDPVEQQMQMQMRDTITEFRNFASVDGLLVELTWGRFETARNEMATRATIPSGIKRIAMSAFYLLHSLQIVTFESGSNLRVISQTVFQECFNLQSICIPASVQTIGWNAFFECKSLKSVTFEKGSSLQDIGESAFSNCSSLQSIIISSTIEKIRYYGFYKCSNLRSITFLPKSNLQRIGPFAFCNTQLSSVIIPANVTYIGEEAFENCLLENVYFEEGISFLRIGKYAFYNCYHLQEISIPARTEYIFDGAFKNCSNLRMVIFEYDDELNKNLKKIGFEAFANCTSLNEIEIPYSVKEIGRSAFKNCNQLRSITFEE
jgi:hypothetical protein